MSNRRGMTLLEVLVAMTILAVGIVGTVGAISALLRAHTAARDYSHAALLAHQVAAELERTATLDAGDLNGTFDNLSDGYTWAATVDATDARGLNGVHITVSWDDGARHFDLHTLLRPHALPTPKPPTPPAAPTTPAATTTPDTSTTTPAPYTVVTPPRPTTTGGGAAAPRPTATAGSTGGRR